MSVEQQKDILDHTFKLLTEFNHGKPPKVASNASVLFNFLIHGCLQGSVAPWWETSKEGVMLLLDKGVEYGELLQIHKLL